MELLTRLSDGELTHKELKSALKRDASLVSFQHNGVTMLMAACRCASRHSVEHLLAANANVDAQDDKGRTCLHHLLSATHRSASVRCKVAVTLLSAPSASVRRLLPMTQAAPPLLSACDCVARLIAADNGSSASLALASRLRRVLPPPPSTALVAINQEEPDAKRARSSTPPTQSYWRSLPRPLTRQPETWSEQLAEAFMQDYDDQGMDPFGGGWQADEAASNKRTQVCAYDATASMSDDEYYSFLYAELSKRMHTSRRKHREFLGADQDEVEAEEQRRETLLGNSAVPRNPALRLQELTRVEHTVQAALFFDKLAAALDSEREESEQTQGEREGQATDGDEGDKDRSEVGAKPAPRGLQGSLTIKDIPFPSTNVVILKEQLLAGAEQEDPRAQRKVLLLAQRRWHPDKWHRYETLIHEKERELVFKRVADVSQSINELLKQVAETSSSSS